MSKDPEPLVIYQQPVRRTALTWYEPGNSALQRLMRRIEEILGPDEYRLGKTSHVRELPDGLLDALTDAYREANGLPAYNPSP